MDQLKKIETAANVQTQDLALSFGDMSLCKFLDKGSTMQHNASVNETNTSNEEWSSSEDDLKQQLKEKFHLAMQKEELLEKMKTINIPALEQFMVLHQELENVNKQIQQQTSIITIGQRDLFELGRERYMKFVESITKINMHLAPIYQALTTNGDCYLSYTPDVTALFEHGVSFQVKPDKRQWKQFSHLSGGQKSLAILALSLAINKVFPSPIYLMDEVDSSLDALVTEKVATFIKQLGENKVDASQFLICSHRPQFYEIFSSIIGTYSVQNEAQAVVLEEGDEPGEE